MKLSTVSLNDNAPFDKDVDPADASKEVLKVTGKTGLLQEKSKNGFLAGVSPRVNMLLEVMQRLRQPGKYFRNGAPWESFLVKSIF